MRLTPAAYVIKIFGGVRATARAVKISPSAVSRWRFCTDVEGNLGRVPGKFQTLILSLAQKKGMDIRPADLLNGRLIKEN